VSLSRDFWTQPIAATLLGQQVCNWLEKFCDKVSARSKFCDVTAELHVNK